MTKRKVISDLKKIRSHWLSRGIKATSMSTKIASLITKGGVKRILNSSDSKGVIDSATKDEIAQEIAESLGELKGLMMKVGQMASYVDFTLPDSARKTLAKLQDSTPPMKPDLIESLIEKELGQPPSKIFKDFSPNPLASASIGQVHWGKLHNGQEVAIKVQYPEIAKVMKSDLANVSLLEKFSFVINPAQEKGVVLEEIRERFMDECDYKLEAKHQEHFRNLFSDVPEVVIPKVEFGYSTKKVIVTHYHKGLRFADFLESSSQAEKNKAGEIIWNMVIKSIFKYHIFNCDPHPGNYLFDQGRVIFLDFGCVKKFEQDFIDQWRGIAHSILADDQEQLNRLIIQAGFVPDPEDFDFDYHRKVMRYIYRPWLTENEFEYTPEYVSESWKHFVKENSNVRKLSMPKDFVFVNRLQWGLNSILADLRASGRWRHQFLNYIGEPPSKVINTKSL